MNKFSFSLLLTLIVSILSITASQSIRLQFLPDAPIDSIKVENLDNQTTHTFTGGSELLFYFGTPTSVEKLTPINDELRVFSTPGNHEVNILFNQKTPGVTTCEIFTTQGRLVSSVQGNLKEEFQSFTFIPDAKGIYLVRVTSGTTTKTAKFISYSNSSVPGLFKNGSVVKVAFKAPALLYENGKLVVNKDDLLRIQCYSGTKTQTLYEYATSDKNYTLRFAERYHQFKLHNIAASKPSFVDVMFAVTDASHKGVDYLNNTDFIIKEDGGNISPTESFRHVKRMNQVPFQIKTVLLIDNSISIVNHLSAVKVAANEFVRKIRPNQYIAVYVFSDTPVQLQDFSSDTLKLQQAINSITLGYPSTNLYGSLIHAFSRWNDQFNLDKVIQGSLVVFTDGSDTQGSSTLNEVISARGAKKVYIIGMGKEIIPDVLNQISNPSGYISINNTSELVETFNQIQADIVRYSRSFYWLNYMSPKRSGTHSLSVSTTENTNATASGVVSGNFDATGFQSVNSGVFVNISNSKLYGVDTIFCYFDNSRFKFFTSRYGNLISQDSLKLTPTTYWAFNVPDYSWSIANTSNFEIKNDNYTSVKLIGKAGGSVVTTLTLTDEANNYSKQIYLEMVEDNIVDDGMYIKGEASAFDKLNTKGLLMPTPNEVDGSYRAGLLDIYIALEKGKYFNLVEVAGGINKVYGPASTFQTVNQADVADQMIGALQMGGYQEGGVFTVPESGLYHIAIDKSNRKIVVMPVTHWAIIGNSTSAGWGENEKTKMIQGAFTKDTTSFQVTNVELRTGDFRFRHSGAWKQTVLYNPDVKINTSIKGTMAATGFGAYKLINLTAGGLGHVRLEKDQEGIYTVTATWGVNTGIQFSLLKTGEVEAISYPENLYITGSDYSWSWDVPTTMIPVHSHPHAFWAIIYSSENAEFKFSPGKAWAGDFGVNGDPTNGIYAKGGSNIKVLAAGYYMVYVDLKAEKISVTSPEVYLIGTTMSGAWGYAMPTAKFTIDNTAKTVTSPAFLAAGELRMYATCALSQQDIPSADWWQMEFMVLDGKIVYRGIGEGLTRVNVTAGQKAVLNFQTGTGVVHK